MRIVFRRLAWGHTLCCVAWLTLAAAGCDLSAYTATPQKRDDPPPAPAVEPTEVAPTVTNDQLTLIDAEQLIERVRARGGRGTVVNVWASWCGSCKRELPMFVALGMAFAPQVDVLFISADEPEARAAAIEILRGASIALPSFAVAGPMSAFKPALHPDWRGALPATFLFDATGKRRHFWEGPVYEHEIMPIVQGFLAGENIDGDSRPPLTGGRTD